MWMTRTKPEGPRVMQALIHLRRLYLSEKAEIGSPRFFPTKRSPRSPNPTMSQKLYRGVFILWSSPPCFLIRRTQRKNTCWLFWPVLSGQSYVSVEKRTHWLKRSPEDLIIRRVHEIPRWVQSGSCFLRVSRLQTTLAGTQSPSTQGFEPWQGGVRRGREPVSLSWVEAELSSRENIWVVSLFLLFNLVSIYDQGLVNGTERDGLDLKLVKFKGTGLVLYVCYNCFIEV